MKDFNLKRLNSTKPLPKPEKRIALGKPLISLLKTLLTLSALAFVIYGFSFLPSYLKQPVKPQFISVAGNSVLTTEAILDYLPIYKNTRWIDIDPFELSKFLVSHPWIEKALIHRRANLGIDIKIVEVSPVAYLNSNDHLYLLTRNYQVLTLERTGKGRNLPVIVHNKLGPIKPGETLPKTSLGKAFELISLLQNHPTLPLDTISEIDISDPLNIQLVVIPNAVRIKLGSSDFEDKLLNLQDALKQLAKEGKNIRYIDLRYKRAVVFRRKV